jgi:hypothetical protein
LLCLAGTKRFPEEKIEYEQETLDGITSNLGISYRDALPGGMDGLDVLEKFQHPPREYWKLRKGKCSDIFFITTLERVPEFVDAVARVAEKNLVDDIGVYVQPLEYGRACHCEFNFMYAPEDVEKIKKMHEDASRDVMDMGGFFTRPYGKWADLVYSKAVSYASTLEKVKQIFDPNRIMNLGNTGEL